MSLLPLKTHITASQPVFAPYTVTGGGGSGVVSTFDTISLNSISSIGYEVVIGQNLAVANTIACSALSTVGITPLSPGNPVIISSLYSAELATSTVGTGTLTVEFITSPPGNDVAFIAPGGGNVTIDLPAPGGIADIQFTVTGGQQAAIGFNGSAVWIGGRPDFEGEIPVSISTLSVSTINGSAPAITTHSQQDVGALFEALFAANPSLSTIVF